MKTRVDPGFIREGLCVFAGHHTSLNKLISEGFRDRFRDLKGNLIYFIEYRIEISRITFITYIWKRDFETLFEPRCQNINVSIRRTEFLIFFINIIHVNAKKKVFSEIRTLCQKIIFVSTVEAARVKITEKPPYEISEWLVKCLLILIILIPDVLGQMPFRQYFRPCF